MSHVLEAGSLRWRHHRPSPSQGLSVWLPDGVFSWCLYMVILCVYVCPKIFFLQGHSHV